MVRQAKGFRRFSSRVRQVAFVCVFGAAIHGCGPKVELLHQEPGFDYATLSAGGIAVFGVTTTVGDREDRDMERDQLTPLLESSLLKERHDLRVLPTGQLLADLGMDLYESSLDRFEDSGSLDRPTLALLDSLAGDKVRYLLLARVEDESISYDETVTDTPSETGSSQELCKWLQAAAF